MAPPRHLPELMDDAVAEILLRLPPDDPACVVRASLVCKPWRRVLSDPAFPRRYRAFHGAPPLLGFLQNGCTDEITYLPHFVPIAARSPLLQLAFDCPAGRVLDCRHGRVLLDKWGSASGMLAVWDPITGDRTLLGEPDGRPDPVWDPITGNRTLLGEPDGRLHYAYTAAVVCAAAGCDHRDCHGGPFLVVFVGSYGAPWERVARAWVYSSEAGEWSAPASVHMAAYSFVPIRRGALAGDELYFVLSRGTAILKYDLGNHGLSVIDSPQVYGTGVVLMPVEDGSLGLACVTASGPSLHLWSRKVNPEGVAAWERFRVISLQKSFRPCKGASVIGFAEGVGVILVGTDASAFTFELSSGRVRKVSKPGRYCYDVSPFMSFYIPDCASRKMPLPEETN